MAAPDRPDTIVRRSSVRRAMLGALLAPPLGAAAYGLCYALGMIAIGFETISGREIFGILVVVPLFAALLGSLLAYPGMLVIGLPSWLLLRRFRAEGALPYAACGFLGGFLLPPMKAEWSVLGESPLLHNAVAGAMTGLIFWRIARDPLTRQFAGRQAPESAA